MLANRQSQPKYLQARVGIFRPLSFKRLNLSAQKPIKIYSNLATPFNSQNQVRIAIKALLFISLIGQNC